MKWEESYKGDLVNLMGGGIHDKELVPSFQPRDGKTGYQEESTEGYPDGAYITKCASCKDTRRVLIFRDSYMGSLFQFISPMFREVIYLRWGYNQECIDKYKPDVVLELPTERYL